MRQLKINQRFTRRNENSVVRYLQDVKRYPRLTPEQEVELAIRIKNGDEVAMRTLVEANLCFVISVAKQFQDQGLSLADLINEGNVGLVRAVSKFDESRGFKFISYAIWWIRQTIMQALSEQTRIVRLPLNQLSSIRMISRANSQLEQRFEREPTSSEIADFLDMEESQITASNTLKNRQVSFDKPMSGNGESDFSLYDLIQEENSPWPDTKLIAESLQIDLRSAISQLSKRESDILILLYGLNDHNPSSLQEIAEQMKMSSERVRQIKSGALLKMKTILCKQNGIYSNM